MTSHTYFKSNKYKQKILTDYKQTTNLSIELVFRGVGVDEIIGSPFDHLQGPIKLPRLLIRISEFDQSPRNRCYGERHGETELHVVTG